MIRTHMIRHVIYVLLQLLTNVYKQEGICSYRVKEFYPTDMYCY